MPAFRTETDAMAWAKGRAGESATTIEGIARGVVSEVSALLARSKGSTAISVTDVQAAVDAELAKLRASMMRIGEDLGTANVEYSSADEEAASKNRNAGAEAGGITAALKV